MQQQQPHVMQTSPLEGYLATALSAARAFSAAAAVLKCDTQQQAYLMIFERI